MKTTVGLYLSASLWLTEAIHWTPFLHDPVLTKHCRLDRKTIALWKHQSSGSWSLRAGDGQNPTSRFSGAKLLKSSTAFLSLLFRQHLQDQSKNHNLGIIASWQAFCARWKRCWHLLDHQLNKRCTIGFSAGTNNLGKVFLNWKYHPFCTSCCYILCGHAGKK